MKTNMSESVSQQRACTQSTVHKSAVSTSIEQRPAAPRTAFPTAGITRPNFDVRCAHASDVLRTVYRCVSLSVACDTTLLRDTYACFVILGSGVDLIRRARHTQNTTRPPSSHAGSGIRQGQGSSRLHVTARTPVHAPRARGLICGRSPEARRHANYVRHVVPRGPVRVRYPTVPPNPPLTYPLPLIPVFELVAHEIDSDRTSRALRPP